MPAAHYKPAVPPMPAAHNMLPAHNMAILTLDMLSIVFHSESLSASSRFAHPINSNASSNAYANAFDGLQTSYFNESMENCTRKLMRYKLGISSGPLPDVLNRSGVAHGLTIEYNGTIIMPKGYLLLLYLCNAFNIKAYLFSIRKRPVIVPASSEPAVETIALSAYTDLYLQKTTWHSLTYNEGSTTPKPHVPTTEAAIVATRKLQDNE